MTRSMPPSTRGSCAQKSGVVANPSLRMLVAGLAARRSSVTENMMLTICCSCMVFARRTSLTSFTVPSSMARREFSPTWIAPLTALVMPLPFQSRYCSASYDAGQYFNPLFLGKLTRIVPHARAGGFLRELCDPAGRDPEPPQIRGQTIGNEQLLYLLTEPGHRVRA